jgi:hypothetical protein
LCKFIQPWSVLQGSVFSALTIPQIFWGPYYSILSTVVNIWTNGNISDDAALRQTFKDHYAHVRSLVPEEKLLEFQVKEGWEPLCTFLGKPVSEKEAFPRVNDAKWTVRLHHYLIYIRLWHLWRNYVITVGVLLSAIGIGYWRMGKGREVTPVIACEDLT